MKMMVEDRREAYVEILEILKHMDKRLVSKIPLELREFFERNASKEYEFYIDSNTPLEKYVLKENTINILAMLNINYWCDNEEHKQELLKKYYENDLKKQEALNNKYSTDNIFKKENKKYEVQSKKDQISTMPASYEANKWYKKIYINILNFIKQIFNKNKGERI